jgi:pimeloyl-ACP methyl ester carboxylesterase
LAETSTFLNTPSTSSQRKFIKVGGTRWAYTESGTEGALWVTFHGYGQSADVMERFMLHFRPEARGVHFDLPHHGETTTEQESISPSNLADLLGKVMHEKGVNRCSLLAFSLGGKVTLKLAELMPGKVERMILIAPDGLKVNPLYRFTANTRFGGWLYGRVINNPNNLFTAAGVLRMSRILHPKIEQFMHRQLDTREKRERVFNVWRTFRNITPDLNDIRSKIQRYNISTVMVFGKHDRIIRPSLGRKLDFGNHPKIRTILLDKGHDLYGSDVAAELRDLIPI